MKLSFFFPAYNDENTVRAMVEKTTGVLEKLVDEFEIIIIDDASPDASGKIADECAAADPRIRVIHHPRNMGYGFALRSGFDAARFEWVFFTDGDMQFDVTEIEQFIARSGEADILIGYKTRRADGFLRTLYGSLFNLTISHFIGLKVRDIDCGFKMIKKSVADDIDVQYPYAESFYIVEMLWRAIHRGYRLIELPVSHYPRQYGKSQLLSVPTALRYIFYTARAFFLRISGQWR